MRASFEQVDRGLDGRIVPIEGTVSEDLKAIDPGLVVRFAERGECYVVFYAHCKDHARHDPQCRVCRLACDNSQAGPGIVRDLVLTRRAHLNALGVWEGLGQDAVDEIRALNPEGPGRYDFAKALERNARRQDARKDAHRKDAIASFSPLAAHSIRKDLGLRYKGRVFLP